MIRCFLKHCMLFISIFDSVNSVINKYIRNLRIFYNYRQFNLLHKTTLIVHYKLTHKYLLISLYTLRYYLLYEHDNIISTNIHTALAIFSYNSYYNTYYRFYFYRILPLYALCNKFYGMHVIDLILKSKSCLFRWLQNTCVSLILLPDGVGRDYKKPYLKFIAKIVIRNGCHCFLNRHMRCLHITIVAVSLIVFFYPYKCSI